MIEVHVSRRGLLAAASGLALLSPGITALARDGGRVDLADRRQLLEAIARMRGAADDRLVIGWIIGARYAVIETRATPMFGILAGTFARYRRLDAETFEARTLELAFFTDPETGAYLERWRNPVTGVTVDVPRTRMGPSRILLTADGLKVADPEGEAAGLEIRHRFRPPVVHQDDVWITEEIRVFGEPREAGGRPFAYNENSSYQASLADLADPTQVAVPVQVSFQSLVSWRPWMGFAETPGHSLACGNGRRALTVADLPAPYLALLERFYPEVLGDPLAALGG
ncbi:MAG: DUF1838 domain-containing protein [Gammaproteobacteria bacterium]|nr:MAG: DUF1838 domain-containing protein [Gammaproteobacteria bacterium]